jgi:hypothetical protein
LRQTWQDFELLVVDDGSTDGTSEYLSSLAAIDSRVKHVRLEENTGLPAYALAQAYPLATGTYFAWLFDDCQLEPDHLETLVGRLQREPGLGMVYAQAQAQLAGDRSFVIGGPLDMDAMSEGANSIPNACVVLPRSTIDRIGWYDPHIILKRLCDWDLWLRVAAEFEIGYEEKILATEFGVGLPGSLGRLNRENGALALKYSRTSRNHRLAPTSLRLEDAYSSDIGIDLEPEERATLHTALLEHQMFTLDTAGAVETASKMSALGLMGLEHDRPNRRGRPTGESKIDDLFTAIVAYTRKRIEEDASSLIRMEVAARDALRAADQRMDELSSVSAQLAESQVEQGRLASALADAPSRVEKSPAEHFDVELARELAETKYSLFIFRDAADRRLEMIRALELQLAERVQDAGKTQSSTEGAPATINRATDSRRNASRKRKPR